ncbi:hypothetical protein G6F57_022646 [Rhizopus arrhizus]|nr:hypothetical protein G6F57_022646 [Rhizopus arrhizus]
MPSTAPASAPAAHAVRAARQGVELAQQREQHHAQRQVQHAEEDAAVAHHEQADHDGRHETGCDARQDQHQRIGARHGARQEGHGIGRDARIHCVAERDLASAGHHRHAKRGNGV